MSRSYLAVLGCTVLYTAIGIGCGLLWIAYTGSTDMPYWVAILLVAAAGLISDLTEQTIRARRSRKQPAAPSHHRKTTV